VAAVVAGAVLLAACGSAGSSSSPPSSAASGPVALGAPASVPESVFTVATPSVPGTPTVYDKVQVRRFGSPDAPHVLVLVPGTNGGAGDFDLVGPYLATHVPGLQVWAEMRREGALQDTSEIEKVLAGKATYLQAFDYYLGWIADPTITHHYQPLSAARYGFVDDWGMAVAMNDLHAVIEQARDGGRRTVTLGGHSLGGEEAAVYAAWDFGGRAGYRDLDGIMCIDGCAGAAGAFGAAPTIASVRTEIGDLATKGPWLDLLGVGLPWATGAFSQVGALAAYEDPTGPATAIEGFPLLPKEFKPPVPVTNAALFGYAFDASTSPAALALIHVHSGHVATSGSPAGWVDDGLTPIEHLADVFAQAPLAAADWYYPERLSIDAGAAASLSQTPVATYLGLRLLHTAQVDVPLYAFQTSLGGTHNAVADSAHAYAAVSRIPSVTVVSRVTTYSHLDPLLASYGQNAFLQSVVPWLRKIGA
jgi:hypothetical protein